MKKTFGFYAAIWAIAIILFNIIVFITPEYPSKFEDGFWIGYIFITITFIGQLLCGFFAFKTESNQKMFYNLSLLSVSYGALIAMLIAGTICMLIPYLPYWIGIIVCLLMLAFNVIAVLKSTLAISTVDKIDQQTKVQTFFIKSLTVDAEHLMNSARTPELKTIAKKAYEAVRYSDPMSNVLLSETEDRIRSSFFAFEDAIMTEDVQLAGNICQDLLSLIDLRNKKCKMLK